MDSNSSLRGYAGQAPAEASASTPQQIRQRISVLAEQLEGQGSRLARIIDHLLGSTPRDVNPGGIGLQAGLVAPGHTSIWSQLEQLDHLMARLTVEIDRLA